MLLFEKYLKVLVDYKKFKEDLISEKKKLEELLEYHKYCFIASPLYKLSFLIWLIFHHNIRGSG